MPSFDEQVSQETGKQNFKPLIPPPVSGVPNIVKSLTPPGSWIRAECVPQTIKDMSDTWPIYFKKLPNVSDYVTSKLERRLQVLAIVYQFDGEYTKIKIELGKEKSSDVTPTEGGISSEGYY